MNDYYYDDDSVVARHANRDNDALYDSLRESDDILAYLKTGGQEDE